MGEQVPWLLVCTKKDLPRNVQEAEVEKFRKEFNFFDYLECSAQMPEGIDQVFDTVAFSYV